MQFWGGYSISDPINGEGSPPTTNKYARRGDIAFIGGGAILVIGLCIAGGLAYFDTLHTSPPKILVEKPTPTPLAQKPSPPAVAEKQAAMADKPSAAAKPAEPTPAVVATDNPPKPPEPQPPPQLQSSPTSLAVTPPLASQPVVEDNEVVDPAARELILRGWASYYLPYSPVRWHEARHNFERALDIDSRSSEARIGLASILSTKLADGWSPVLQEDMPRAEHLLLGAVDKGAVSSRAAAHFTLGVLRQMQNRLPEANSEFETAISLDPNNPRTYLHLGQTRLFLGQPEAGIPPLEQAIRLGPNDPNVATTYWALGTCKLLLGQMDQAIDLLQTARTANARLWVPYLYLAGAYGLKGDLDRARSALAESLRLKPALRSIARMRAENPWLSNPQYWAFQEKTLNLGLRRAGFPDQ
jgi:tetratricopeptide (TPR) repeat protein